jgi:N utilization substance protein A
MLDGFELSRDEAESLIMQARVKAGWVKEEDIAKPAEAEAEADAEAATETEQAQA